MTANRSDLTREESLWFGESDRPLFGRLTMPSSDSCLGGVLLSPPIGRESRLARRALRSLAIFLAQDGYVSLRFDHFGTGDSSGSLDDEGLEDAWIEGIEQGASLLRSLGVTTVSAVGMRMGATILGTASAKHDLGLSSVVLWDPCESGRSYARELSALGALRQDVITDALGDEPTTMLEYALSDDAITRLDRFSLRDPLPRPLAKRLLIVVRDDRTVSGKFKSIWESEDAEWLSTSEQGPLFEGQIPTSVQPISTIAQVREWLTVTQSTSTHFTVPPLERNAIVAKRSGAFEVRERIVALGSRQMFGVVSEPTIETHGPLVVMVNGVNEDHVGPARLWVELSRRWAGMGLRCVRFDLKELGESPWSPNQPDRPVFDKTRSIDVDQAVRALIPENPAHSVLVGYCSGAQLALEVAPELQSMGVCAINPQVGAGVFRNVDRIKTSDHDSVQSFVRRFEDLLRQHRWFDKAIRQLSLLAISSVYPPRIGQRLRSQSDILLLLSPEDISPLRRVPILGEVFRRRLESSDRVRVEIVPGMDHSILSTLGRNRAVAILDRHVIENYVQDAATLRRGPVGTDS